MLLLAWVLLGLSFLAFEAGSLSLTAQQGTFVSPLGALKFNLEPAATAQVPYAKWPWGDVSIGSMLSGAIKGIF